MAPAPAPMPPSADAAPPSAWAPPPAAVAPAAAASAWAAPSPTAAPTDAPPTAAPPAWVAPAAASGWVAPAETPRGHVTGLAKLGALILLLMGTFWTLAGVGLIAAGGAIKDSIDSSEFRGLGDIASGALIATGTGVAIFAIVEILVGIFAWRGHGFARVLGILYGLVFGVGALSVGLGARSNATSGTAAGVGILVAIAVAYLYVALVFLVRYRSRT